jgi:general secretion pathway protein E
MSVHEIENLELISSADMLSPYFIKEDDKSRGVLAFDDINNILYVCNGKETDIELMTFSARLEREGNHTYEIESISYQELVKLYKSGEGIIHNNDSDNQKVVLKLVSDAIKKDASDIHLLTKNDQISIKFRINGDLNQQQITQETDKGIALFRTTYSSMTDVAEPYFKEEEKQDGRVSKAYLDQLGLIGARIATTPTDTGMLMVIRLLKNNDDTFTTIKDLGYSDLHLEMLEKLQKKKRGITIISGETGSGKTTTLECIMRALVRETKGRKHIYTIENPPENSIDGVVHTPIQCDNFDDEKAVSESWARAISSSLRHDPDIIIIGEARDGASAKAVFRAGMTGHRVFTTIHANDALSILDRLEDEGVKMSLLCNPKLMVGLMNQCLVPVSCSHCRIPLVGNEELLPRDLYQRVLKYTSHSKSTLYLRGNGCEKCNFTGISGRSVVAEIIIPTFKLLDLYKREGNAAARKYWMDKENGQTICKHLIEKVNSGLVDPSVAEEYVCMLDDDE